MPYLNQRRQKSQCPFIKALKKIGSGPTALTKTMLTVIEYVVVNFL